MIRIATSAPGGLPLLALDAATTAAKLDTSDVAGVTDVIRQVTALAESIVSYRWVWFRGYRADVEGSDTERLYLDAGRPVAAVSSVKLGTDGTPLTEGEADDYEVFAADGFLYNPDTWTASGTLWIVEWTGGWWLPSMGDAAEAAAAGATRLTDGAAHVERAIYEIVRTTWTSDEREPGLKREEHPDMELEYFGDVTAPKLSLDVIRCLGLPTTM